MRVNQLTTQAAAGSWQSGEVCEARQLATNQIKVYISCDRVKGASLAARARHNQFFSLPQKANYGII